MASMPESFSTSSMPARVLVASPVTRSGRLPKACDDAGDGVGVRGSEHRASHVRPDLLDCRRAVVGLQGEAPTSATTTSASTAAMRERRLRRT